MQSPQPWRRNLWLLCAAQFIVNAGFSLIMPFLPYYVQSMGVQGHAVEIWTGVIFSVTFVSAAIALPFWGQLSDRTGRRPMMLRSCIGMGLITALMGLTTAPWQLVGLRLLLGLSFGFLPSMIAYMTAITPKEHTGFMLGMIQTSMTAGGILGPLLGGVLASFMGYSHIFYLTGAACLISAGMIYLFLKEEFKPAPVTQQPHLADSFRTVAASPTLLAMMLVMMVQCLSIMNAEPIIPLYLATLNVPVSLLKFLSGAVFSVVGVATVLVAPTLGRLGDRWGYKQVLLLCLAGVTVMYTLQGLAATWWELMAFRFGQGCFAGGVFAAANALTSLGASRESQGRIFSIAGSAQQVGNFLGPLVGAGVAASLSLRAVFPVTALLCLANLCYVWFVVPAKPPARAGDDAADGETEARPLSIGH